MRILPLVLLTSTAVLRSSAGPIDFSPTIGQRELEGIIFPQVVFHQDGHAISYEQPRHWKCSGDSARLSLTPSDVGQAAATLTQAPLPAQPVFDEATTNGLKRSVLESLPSEAQNAHLVSEEQNPVRINQRESYAVTVSYSYFGQDYMACVVFVNLVDTQLRARLIARKADFDALQRA